MKRKIIKLRDKWKSENIEEMEHDQELVLQKRMKLKVLFSSYKVPKRTIYKMNQKLVTSID